MTLRDVSFRATDLSPSKIRDVAELGMGDPDVIPLWFGEAAWRSPLLAIDAAKISLDRDPTHYQPNSGLPALREAIAGYLSALHKVSIPANRITVSASAMQGLMLSAQTLTTPGDRVVMIAPDWPNIAAAFTIAGGQVEKVALTVADGRWTLDLDELIDALTPDTRCLMINTPNNPTGWTLSAENRQVLLDHCRKHGIWIVADEVYNRLYRHGTAAPSFVEITEPEDRFIGLNSFSKAWAMTGWRLGWMVTPPELEAPLAMLTEFNIAGAPPFVQAAGVSVVSEGETFVAQQRDRLAAGYALVAERLGQMDRVEFIKPDGAFYAFFRIDGLNDSLETAKDILSKTKVGLAPGIAFGEQGEGHLRLCYAQPVDLLNRALDRLEQYFRR
ncbi:MAG: pyridoxal phosphate-dependent aminotransferase [Alphaproteobacteria bacterium]